MASAPAVAPMLATRAASSACRFANMPPESAATDAVEAAGSGAVDTPPSNSLVSHSPNVLVPPSTAPPFNGSGVLTGSARNAQSWAARALKSRGFEQLDQVVADVPVVVSAVRRIEVACRFE